MISRRILFVFAALGASTWLSPAFAENGAVDTTPRTAVISAYPPELEALLPHVNVERAVSINGTAFTLGTIGGAPVVLFSSGISMVNAAMMTQLVLDRFTIKAIVFSGIAGGVDAQLRIGDVLVADQWAQYLESVFARETGDGYELPEWAKKDFRNFSLIHPQPAEVRNADNPEGVGMYWFPVDPTLMARARAAAPKIKLDDCVTPDQCLTREPKVVIGGNGVSGQAFVDNANFRAYAQEVFGARVVDMETAAVAAVAFTDKVPFIAFRSVSDLVGGSAGANEMKTFETLAARNAVTALKAFLEAKD
jgi:adenosylhomocysteine nucleosidase